MNKKFLFILILCLFSLPSFSQWSIKGGVDYGTMTGDDDINYRFGFHVGAAYDVELSDRLYFQPSLLLSKHSFGFDALWDALEGEVDRYVLEVPAVISFRPLLDDEARLMLDAGLYTKLGLWGDREYTLLNHFKSKKSTYDDYNRFDLGLNLGIGVNFRMMYVMLGYQFSFTEAHKDISGTHYQNFRISLGYKF